MKLIKALLIAVIVVTAYLLFLQWQFDYGNKPAVELMQPVGQAGQQIRQRDQFPGTDQQLSYEQHYGQQYEQTIAGKQPSVLKADADNIEVLSAPTTGRSTRVDVNAVASLVKLETDTMLVHLDLRGGDIVYLALKDYKRGLNSKQPLVLLSDQSFTYVAQSGLIGADGIDNQKQRPLYKISHKTNHTRAT